MRQRPFISCLMLTVALGWGGGPLAPAQTSSPKTFLEYAGFVGGDGDDAIWAAAVDAQGCLYVTGHTRSAGLATPGAWQTNAPRGQILGDAFVAKFSADGTQVLYWTYLGGRGEDAALGLAVDSDGCAYVTGVTDSADFPTVSALRTHIGGVPTSGVYPLDGFVAKLSPDGRALLYSTYLGGSGLDQGVAIAVDADRRAWVTGFTYSDDFPVTNAPFARRQGDRDAFVSQISSNGTVLLSSTYLGGTNADAGQGIALGGCGDVYVTGWTASTNFPVTTSALQPWLAGGLDAFVTILTDSGRHLALSTYFGGEGDDVAYRLAVDQSANAVVTGAKLSANFPVRPGPLNPGGIALSTDEGVTWQPRHQGLEHFAVSVLAIDPAQPDRLFAGTGRGVVRSGDAGATWQPVRPAQAGQGGLAPAPAVDTITALLLSAANPPKLVVGTATRGVHVSTDGGATWTPANTGLLDLSVRALVADPGAPDTWFAGTLSGVFRSTNGGANWARVNSGLDNTTVRALAVNPATTPATLFAATAGGVYRSDNQGNIWFSRNTGLTNLNLQALAVRPGNPPVLYAGAFRGVYCSTDGGSNWTTLAAAAGFSNVLALLVDARLPDTVYAATGEGLFRSTDAGVTWTTLRSEPTACVALHPETPGGLYAGAAGRAVLGLQDIFLARLGTQLHSAVVLGGVGVDEGWDVALDAQDNAYLTGRTASPDFPALPDTGLLRTNRGGRDAFVAAVDASGSALLLSGLLGGAVEDGGAGIAVDHAGGVYVAGRTYSTNFPTVNPLRSALKGTGSDGFVARLSSRPALEIDTENGAVRLTWRALSPGWQLETTPQLTVTNDWRTVATPPVSTQGWHTVTLPHTNPATFFRLRR